MIELVNPDDVAGVNRTDDVLNGELLSGESAIIAKSVEKRRREFVTVCACARAGLRIMGVEPIPILHYSQGCPIWPSGFVGSMAHCRDFRAAAVARSANFEAIGIYAEPHEPLTSSLINAIAMPTEIHLFPSITKIGIASERLLYCTKEAVYKPWHPITKHYLDFTDVAINLNPNRTFTGSGTNDSDAGLLARTSGRRAASKGIVLASVFVLADDHHRP